MPTYLLIAGTRPEVIKLAPVAAALRKRGATAEFCAVGQHGDLLQDALADFGEIPRYTVLPFQRGREPAPLLSQILELLPPLFREISPNAVIVQGDTTTALGGALAAFYEKLPLIHVEAGLRTYLPTPFPEEAHRRMIAPLANLHLCPTETDADALYQERVPGRIATTGNSGLDGLRLILARPTPALPRWEGRVVLCTLHRRENIAKLPRFLHALGEISESIPDCTILFPSHPSPDLQKLTGEFGSLPRFQILPPLPYPVCAHLLPRLSLLLTDSGGLQEEAAFLGIPTLVLREKSERGDAPSLRIIGSDPQTMAEKAIFLLTHEEERARLCLSSTRYGDGHAADRMAEEILAST
ncbi:MAG: UDP-N-acetylglucosamine 2-epimerase (non-hydrolyzing) [Clostridia bacterium]|nr:UDP-N-acetylglucosamine 2-epimerase (non-hydrolyzing) [Clostridia bacterium]